MAQVKVWNDNIYPYKETFRDKNIEIAPKSFIMMEEGEAQLFKGAFAPIQVNADGHPIPQGFKMIRIEENTGSFDAETVVGAQSCQACGYQAASAKDLNEHLTANHSDQRLTDAEAERALAQKKKRA